MVGLLEAALALGVFAWALHQSAEAAARTMAFGSVLLQAGLVAIPARAGSVAGSGCAFPATMAP